MTAVLTPDALDDRTVLLDRIEAEAVQVDFGQSFRTGAGLIVYKVFRLVGAAVRSVAWCVAAAKVGYRDGRGTTRVVESGRR